MPGFGPIASSPIMALLLSLAANATSDVRVLMPADDYRVRVPSDDYVVQVPANEGTVLM